MGWFEGVPVDADFLESCQIDVILLEYVFETFCLVGLVKPKWHAIGVGGEEVDRVL